MLIEADYSAAMAMANTTGYLLKQGFDLFGLIDAGLAIDKTKIDTNEQ